MSCSMCSTTSRSSASLGFDGGGVDEGVGELRESFMSVSVSMPMPTVAAQPLASDCVVSLPADVASEFV